RDGVWLDKRGELFIDESRQIRGLHDVYYDLIAYDPATEDHPRIPSYWFFDSRVAAAPLTTRGAVEVGLYEWSADNSKEIANGWIFTGGTVAECAERAGILAPDAAERAVAEFNRL